MAEQTQMPEVVFNIEKVYVKDLSFESPGAPAMFFDQSSGPPQVDIRLDVEHALVSEGLYEVVLAVTATTKVQDKTLFLVEAHQAGLFHVKGVAAEDLPKILQITCPGILLPFARETLHDMVAKGGYPQFLINPVNFEALYFQQKEAASRSQQPGPG